MRTPIYRKAGMGRVLCFVASLMTVTSTPVLAQTNSWINSASGSWDDATSWSLGVLPGSSQSVMITNSGYKAVAINPSTPVNFPGSMTVSSLTIRGSTNTENTLLLNYFGTAVPLTVSGGLTVADDAQILNFNSGLIVQGGSFTVTNSQINQDGGFILTTNAGMSLQDSVYNLTNGDFEASYVGLGYVAAAQINQYGGTVTIANLSFGDTGMGSGGAYSLYGGNLNLPGGMSLVGNNNSSSSYFQADGTNLTTEVVMEPGIFGLSPSFTLNGGLLADNDVAIDADNYGGAGITQNGGTHVITNALSMRGGAISATDSHPGQYTLNGGTLSAGSMTLDASEGTAAFNESAGIAQVGNIQGRPSQNPSDFVASVNLSGGTLNCSNLYVTDGGNISQSGGALIVSNSLAFDGFIQPGPRFYSTYNLTAGTLFASNISVGGIWIIGDSTTNRITNPGTCTLSNTLQIGNATEQLGRFILSSNGLINLAGSASQLSFANSSGQTWSGTLLVSNWNGSLSGGGAEQLKFGTDQTGLTTAQLSQVQFTNPAGLPGGSYSARILSDGEVVPNQGSSSGPGQTNSWVNAGSGNWENATSWSLGVPPGAGQTVLITNSGFKAVAIQSSTVSNAPQSLSVNSVTITSPTNSANTLLMNFAGAGSPLVIGVDSNTPGTLVIGDTNSAMTMFSSGLTVNNSLGTNNTRLGEFAVDGTFNQSDGSEVVAGFLDLNGTYNLTNGNVFVETQFINGTFNEQGGTNLATGVALNGTGGHYVLVAGTLNAGSLTLTNGAAFDQSGGDNTNSVMIMSGTTNSVGNPVTAVYTFNGGTLETTSLTMNTASFNHYAGNDSIGTLSMSNAPSSYVINSGSLAVDQIQLSANAAFYHTSGVMTGTKNVTLANGEWVEQGSGVQLGQLQLSSGASSGIALTSGSCVLRFADSSSVSWASGGRLTIQDWSGSLNGGGSEQLYFGTSASGLTAQQLSQVQFSNPAGLPSGTYSAQILSDGEVVPGQAISSSGLVNSWINPASGNWDNAASWSLGILPNSTQMVLITNSGSKSVAINPSTPTNFPGSMTVSNLTIQGSTNTVNTLLLNSFGTATPLTMLNGLTLQNNAQILDLNSGLVVQSGNVTVTNSQINQNGGFINTTNAPMILQNSVYNLTNGLFQGGTVTLGSPSPADFNQYDGTALITNLVFGGAAFTGGHYALYGGELSLPNGLTIINSDNESSSYFQAGGTNQTTSVFLEPGLSGQSPSFTLSGGLLADNNVKLTADSFGGITLTQNGGTHIITNGLSIPGASSSPTEVHPAVYQLNSGTLSAGSISMDATSGTAYFNQTNGTASVGQILAHSNPNNSFWVCTVNLSGGTLSSSSINVTDGTQINQTGGSLVVSNSLAFNGFINPGRAIYSTYTLLGGTLNANNINVGGIFSIGDGTTNRISNAGTFTLSDILVISNATEQLGHFILPGNAAINLAGSASKLNFANSSGQTWAGGATLVISNWNGNPSGGGAEQLKFGTDQTGLTPVQLSQVQFNNPAGLPGGTYSARILGDGEVVPGQVAAPLTFSAQGKNLVLTWPSGYTLQTATNATGPYTNVSGATSPYTNDMTLSAQRFFRFAQ